MGHGPDVACRKLTQATRMRAYEPLPCSRWVQNRLICTRTERDAGHQGPMELDLGDPTTWVWAMGPLAHAMNLCSRSGHYRTTRGGCDSPIGLNRHCYSSRARARSRHYMYVDICALYWNALHGRWLWLMAPA